MPTRRYAPEPALKSVSKSARDPCQRASITTCQRDAVRHRTCSKACPRTSRTKLRNLLHDLLRNLPRHLLTQLPLLQNLRRPLSCSVGEKHNKLTDTWTDVCHQPPMFLTDSHGFVRVGVTLSLLAEVQVPDHAGHAKLLGNHLFVAEPETAYVVGCFQGGL